MEIPQVVDVKSDELISIQGSSQGDLRIVDRRLKRREYALVEEERVGSWPIPAVDDYVIAVAADHLALIVDTRELRVAGRRVIDSRELPALVDEPMTHGVLIFVAADDNAI